MAKCKSCGAEIFWVKMASRKAMPCDAAMIPYREDPSGKDIVITPNGETIRCVFDGPPELNTGIGRLSHFATCPAAAAHRKGARHDKRSSP